MVFSTFTFISIFLPIVWLLQTLCRSILWKNIILLAASLVFYGYGEPVYILLLIGSALASWLVALKIDQSGQDSSRKALLVLSCIIHLGLLGVFKYAAFLTETINEITHLGIPVPHIALPIGISFYTFQALSYVIDVYRGKCRSQKNFFWMLLYLSFFPQLIAGPIVRYTDIEKELTDRKVTFEGTLSGMMRFSVGLARKILISDSCALVADSVFGAHISSVGTLSAWLAAGTYMLQIYFDFSGYSDMAIGLGEMFGFHFLENFRNPYAASSIRDFWTRWHISLSSWLREYLYYPLGGNRKGKVRTVFNRMVVFVLCGLWHGAGFTFLFWGFYHGLLTAIEGFIPWFHKDTKHSVFGKIIMHIYTVLAVMIGFVFFRADTIGQGFDMLGKMFTLSSPANGQVLLYSLLTPENLVMIAAAIFFCFPVSTWIRKRSQAVSTTRFGRFWYAVSPVLSLACMALSVIHMSTGGYSPFIYFRF